jgi:hypothetical protein
MKHILTTMWERHYWLHAKFEIQAILLQSMELMPITPSFWESVVNHIISCVPPPFKRCLSNLTYFVFHKSYITLFPYVLLSPFSPPLPPMLSIIYLWSNFEGCLFVLFCFVCRIKIYQTHVDVFCHTLHNIGKPSMDG